jgi:RNA polymerase sigma-70 factor (ECF subfamily)
VCHAGLSWREQDARRNAGEPFDDDPDPEAQLLQQDTVARVREAIGELPVEFREVIVLREMEGLSYKEIATVVRVPIGTVMSRLSRARERLLADLQAAADLEALP